MFRGLALGFALLAVQPPARPARAQAGVEVCSRLTPAEAGSLIGGVVVTPRSTGTAEMANLADTVMPAASGAGAAPADTPADAVADPVAKPVTGGACSYLAAAAGATGLPPSQVQLAVNRFRDANAADQAFDAARKAIRLMRPAAASVDTPAQKDEGARTFSAETTALAVKGDTLVLLSVIDFTQLIRGKPDPAVMERARLLARRVAGM